MEIGVKRLDLTGQKFSRLTVLSFVGSVKQGKQKRIMWLCKCDCGNETIVQAGNLVSANVQSCGCLKKEMRGEKNSYFKHGYTKTPTYSVWLNMKNRCYNQSLKDYKNYGERGIKVCDSWKENFINFLADMGRKPEKLMLERVDNSKGYSPDNCRWASRKEQNRNKRTNRRIEFKGEIKCLNDWAKEFKVNRVTLYRKLKKYSPEIVFSHMIGSHVTHRS